MKTIFKAILLCLGLMIVSPAMGAPATIRVPMCLQYSDNPHYVPCTGVVPVDNTTGDALNWSDVLNYADHSVEIDRGANVTTTPTTLAPANLQRHGWAIQVQPGGGDCYVNTSGTATQDFHSLKIPSGSYAENPFRHVTTGAISVVCTTNPTGVYLKEW